MKNKNLLKHTYIIEDWVKVHDALAELIQNTPEFNNLRYIRHLAKLKIKISNQKNGVYSLTEKQISHIKIALEKYNFEFLF